MTVFELIGALGGSAAVGRALQVPLTTVDGWKRANRVPRWRQAGLASLAVQQGVPFTGFVSDEISKAASHVSIPPAAEAPAPVVLRNVRIITCAVCDKRLDDRTIRSCQWQDCPQNERWAA